MNKEEKMKNNKQKKAKPKTMLLREKCLHILLEHFLGSDIFAKSAATAADGGGWMMMLTMQMMVIDFFFFFFAVTHREFIQQYIIGLYMELLIASQYMNRYTSCMKGVSVMAG